MTFKETLFTWGKLPHCKHPNVLIDICHIHSQLFFQKNLKVEFKLNNESFHMINQFDSISYFIGDYILEHK